MKNYRFLTMKYLLTLLFPLFAYTSVHAQTIASIMNTYQGYDMNSDGIIEINNLTYLPFENKSSNLNSTNKLVLVLVEDRILDPLSNSRYSTTDLLNRLEQYKDDLKAEGYATRFIKASIYNGAQHQDGQTLLAIRNFLKDVKQSWNLQGLVLVGAFPEAMLVRRWIWRRKTNVNIAGVDYKGDNQKEFLRIVPEIVAHRADLVLADLDGKWENLYVKNSTKLESIEALPAPGLLSNWPVNNMTFTSTKFNDKTITFQDFFWLKDDNFKRFNTLDGSLKLKLYTAQKNPEISSANKAQKNPIALPDILVSRINAKNIAVIPDRSFKDMNGKGFLDANGKPQTIETTQNITPKTYLKKDPIVERQLLMHYFYRNHHYRTGGNPTNSHKTAAVNFGSGLINATNLNAYLKKASPTFSPSFSCNDASLYQYVQLLKMPATLKGMSAHSNPWNSKYGISYNPTKLENLVGGKPWRWKKEQHGKIFKYIPSLAEQNGDADAYLHRTIYENRILLGKGASLFIHNGCEVNSPGNAATTRYSHTNYASPTGFQNAESILFFLNGVAIVSRAKVFYDKPEGFTEELGKNERSHFGDGWKAYFLRESQDLNLSTKIASNKRAYTWGILGDWTLRIKYENGLGIFKIQGNSLTAQSIHSDKSWFESWNFDAKLDKIEGIGDFNGDKKEDIVVSSGWGIGVISRNKNQWKSLMSKPKDTWFGQWRYNASTNSGSDKIQAIADFNGDGKDEILMTSSWGIGILKLNGTTFSSIVSKPNATSFSGWLFNSKGNKIEGTGDFNGDGKEDILISSPWGIGVLTLSGNTLTSLLVKPNNTRFGQWRYSTLDKIQAIADFNGDGKDEILITSGWGIGMLKLSGNTFNSIIAKPNKTSFNGWSFNSKDNKIERTGDFNGDGKEDILISSPWGIGVLTLSNTTLSSLAAKPKNTWFGQWRYNASTNSGLDKIQAVGDFNNDGKEDVLITSSWGIGVLKLNGSSFSSIMTKPYGQQIGSWHLKATNNFPLIGNFDGALGEEILIRN